MQLSLHSATNDGSFSSWACYVFNSSYWNPLASQLNTQPTDWEGESPRVSVYHTLLPCPRQTALTCSHLHITVRRPRPPPRYSSI